MSKHLHLVLVVLGFVLITASAAIAQPARVRVRAPSAPDSVSSAGECSAQIPMPLRRKACFACVNRGGRYYLNSNNCQEQAAPPPLASIARSVHDCNTIPFGPKRNRCVSCVSPGGTYIIHANNGFGQCNQAAPPPPPPSDRNIQRTNTECYAEIHQADKRLRCQTCVQNGGTYFKNAGNGFGQCTNATPPSERRLLRTVSDCRAYLKHPGKRARCVSCTSGGGTFGRYWDDGAGDCEAAAPPPPPPHHGKIRTVAECVNQIAHMGTRNQCRKCVQKGGRWDRNDGCRF